MEFEPDYIKVSEYAKRMSLHTKTVYKKFYEGEIEGIRNNKGSILVKNPFKQNNNSCNNNLNGIKVALYTRVSSSQNKGNLDGQLDRIRQYAISKGYTIVLEVKEVGSGLNDNRPKLKKLLTKDINKYDIIIVEHKDRLTRFGFNYISDLMDLLGKKLDIVNLVEGDEEDLIQDFVSIITSFCSRIYGKRRGRRKATELINKLEE